MKFPGEGAGFHTFAEMMVSSPESRQRESTPDFLSFPGAQPDLLARPLTRFQAPWAPWGAQHSQTPGGKLGHLSFLLQMGKPRPKEVS